ncbi:MAG: hypothetical protein NVSMB33_04350 [Ktedonobacteraceae bacterium]
MNNCLDILAPSDEELLSIASDDRTLPIEEQEHLAQCPICQQRLASYINTRNRLLAKLYRSICPSAIELNYYCIGMVSEQKRISIASHILDCPLCTDEVAEIRKAQASVDLFPTLAPSLSTRLRRIFATLVVQQVQPVTRAEQPDIGWPRQYHTDSIDLSLHLSLASNQEIMLLGIITSTDPTQTLDAFQDRQVGLYTAPGPLNDETTPQPLLSTQIDEVGNIFLENVPAGEYIMLIHLPDQEVVIEGLNITHG